LNAIAPLLYEYNEHKGTSVAKIEESYDSFNTLLEKQIKFLGDIEKERVIAVERRIKELEQQIETIKKENETQTQGYEGLISSIKTQILTSEKNKKEFIEGLNTHRGNFL